MLDGTDVKRLILFYRSASRRLSVLVNPDNEALAHKKQIEEASLQELGKIQYFVEATIT